MISVFSLLITIPLKLAVNQQTVSSGSTSSSLLHRVRQHDSQAWERLTYLYTPLVYAWSRKCGVASEDAMDVCQEVFRAIHRSINDFRRERPGDSFRGWLWTITRNKVRDHFRAAGKTPAALGGTDAHHQFTQLPDAEPATESHAASGSSNSLFRRGLELVRAEFEDKTWQAFWRVTIDEVATKDVAAELGMSTGAVRKAKFRVLRRLREELHGLIDAD